MTSMRRVWTSALVAAIAATGVACEKNTSSNVVIGETAGGDQLTKNIVVHNPKFAKSVKILDLKVRREKDLLEGFVTLQNQTDDTVPFEYRMEWYDQDQMPIDTPITSWKPLTVDGRMTKVLHELSPRTEATGFKFYVREPNSVER